MNFRLVFRLAGRVLMLVSPIMTVPLFVALYYGEDAMPFLCGMIAMFLVGVVLSHIPARKGFFTCEGFFSVALIWLMIGLCGAVPFYVSGYFGGIINCIFESISGFSTTGATILPDIEAVPKALLFWRAMTNWLGGMGVLVLTTAVLPSMGIRSHYLTQAETPGLCVFKACPQTGTNIQNFIHHLLRAYSAAGALPASCRSSFI